MIRRTRDAPHDLSAAVAAKCGSRTQKASGFRQRQEARCVRSRT